MLSERFWICFMILLVSCATWTPERAEAGCGCLKPPPVPAEVRPRATMREASYTCSTQRSRRAAATG